MRDQADRDALFYLVVHSESSASEAKPSRELVDASSFTAQLGKHADKKAALKLLQGVSDSQLKRRCSKVVEETTQDLLGDEWLGVLAFTMQNLEQVYELANFLLTYVLGWIPGRGGKITVVIADRKKGKVKIELTGPATNRLEEVVDQIARFTGLSPTKTKNS